MTNWHSSLWALRLKQCGAIVAAITLFLPAYEPVEHLNFFGALLGLPLQSQAYSFWEMRPHLGTVVLVLAIVIVFGKNVFRPDRFMLISELSILALIGTISYSAFSFLRLAESIEPFGWGWLAFMISSVILLVGIYLEHKQVFDIPRMPMKNRTQLPENACLSCGSIIPSECNSCPQCGWTWEQNSN